MQFISLKHNLCVSLAELPKLNELKNNRAFFVTPAGVFSGVLAPQNQEEAFDAGENAYMTMLSTTYELLKNNIDMDEGTTRAPHDGCLLLRDVEIYPLNQLLSTPIVKMRNCILFTSSVISVFLADVPPANAEATQA